MMTLHEAQIIAVLIRDLDDVTAYDEDQPPPDFLEGQDDEIRKGAWVAALGYAEQRIRARLREKGVDA